MLIAYTVAMKSKDRSTSVGCIIVGPDNEIRTTGYNNFVRGWDDNDERNHERPYKYTIIEHSERNAVYNAARIGAQLKDCTMYTTWFPCADCARGIVQSGIKKVVYHRENPLNNNSNWLESQKTGELILKSNGVEIIEWTGQIPRLSIRINGTEVDPTTF